ncbi:hypothetical protein NDU88_004254 [Pleurodeles waltl]|uniref:Uncharacterized protein n=1 Tax=Pleurodeles waltl TaxID=8319 RepID=A0AAV7NM62_PLEWA|nr:hypothetical protein NDU88_004254 [Pleurodeles waltl]
MVVFPADEALSKAVSERVCRRCTGSEGPMPTFLWNLMVAAAESLPFCAPSPPYSSGRCQDLEKCTVVPRSEPESRRTSTGRCCGRLQAAVPHASCTRDLVSLSSAGVMEETREMPCPDYPCGQATRR